MGDHSQEQQALKKIQHEWAQARIKDDSSYTRRIEASDCMIVWPHGRIVNKQGDLASMTGDIVFSEFQDSRSANAPVWRHWNRRRRGRHQSAKGKQDLLSGKFVWTDTFLKQGGQWKASASQITPVLEK